MFYPIGYGGSHWLLYIGVPLIIGIWAQIRVSSAFGRWSKVRASSNITGAECAREILQAAQIHDVEVVETNDFLGDHYDPTKKRLCLSSNVYNTPSVAALGIAAHETGHAIQHAKAYAPLKADRKSTRLNSSHTVISYAVFCLKKKNNKTRQSTNTIATDNTTHVKDRITSESEKQDEQNKEVDDMAEPNDAQVVTKVTLAADKT